jgi:hypothetical protein
MKTDGRTAEGALRVDSQGDERGRCLIRGSSPTVQKLTFQRRLPVHPGDAGAGAAQAQQAHARCAGGVHGRLRLRAPCEGRGSLRAAARPLR